MYTVALMLNDDRGTLSCTVEVSGENATSAKLYWLLNGKNLEGSDEQRISHHWNYSNDNVSVGHGVINITDLKNNSRLTCVVNLNYRFYFSSE